MKIIFSANSKKSFSNYRIDLFKKVSEDYNCTFEKFLNIIVKSIYYGMNDYLIVSSDGQCNLALCLCPWLNRVVIVNGMGRFEKNKLVRKIFLTAIILNNNNIVIFQNYRDFRFARRFYNKKNIYWIPGSGGVRRQSGQAPGILFLTRDNKIQFFWSQIEKILPDLPELRIVGLKNTSIQNRRLKNIGIVPQEDIFSHGNCLLQLYAYGDGVPHTLVDGICSNLDIIISRQAWTNFGFYKIIDRREVNDHASLNSFYHLRSGSSVISTLSETLNKSRINNDYYKHIKRKLPK